MRCDGSKEKLCPEGTARYDAQGIYLCRACPKCEKAKLAGFRRVILEGYTQADVSESIEPDEPIKPVEF